MFVAGEDSGFGGGGLADVCAALERVDLDACDAAGLASVTVLLRRLQGHVDVLTAKVASRAAVLCSTGASAPPEEMLISAGRMGGREARRVAQRAETLVSAPSMAAALSSGAITGVHADVLGGAMKGLEPDARSEMVAREGELARAVSRMSPEKFAAHCRRLAGQLAGDDGLSRFEKQRHETRLRLWQDDMSGMYRLEGQFDPETGLRIATALDHEVDAMRAASGHTAVVEDLANDNGHLAAHALATLVSTASRDRRPGLSELCVHIDDETLRRGLHEHSVCELADGTEIPVGVARRLACEAEIFPVVYGADSDVLDVGRGQRLANRAQRRALRKMYRTCAWNGCNVKFAWCHIHHIDPWTAGGPTDLANLLPLCTRHHHAVHEGGWAICLDGSRTLHVTRPDGEHHASVPLESGSCGGRVTTAERDRLDAERRPASRAAPALGP